MQAQGSITFFAMIMIAVFAILVFVVASKLIRKFLTLEDSKKNYLYVPMFVALAVFSGLFLIKSGRHIIADFYPGTVVPGVDTLAVDPYLHEYTDHDLSPVELYLAKGAGKLPWYEEKSATSQSVQATSYQSASNHGSGGPPLNFKTDFALWTFVVFAILILIGLSFSKLAFKKNTFVKILMVFTAIVVLGFMGSFVVYVEHETAATVVNVEMARTRQAEVAALEQRVEAVGTSQKTIPEVIEKQADLIQENAETLAKNLEEKAKVLELKADQLTELIDSQTEQLTKAVENKVDNVVKSIEKLITKTTEEKEKVLKEAELTRKKIEEIHSRQNIDQSPKTVNVEKEGDPTVQIAVRVPEVDPKNSSEGTGENLPEWTQFEKNVLRKGDKYFVKSEQFATKEEAKVDALMKAKTAIRDHNWPGMKNELTPDLVSVFKIHTEEIERKVDDHTFKVYRAYLETELNEAELQRKAFVFQRVQNERRAFDLIILVVGIALLLIVALVISNRKLKKKPVSANKPMTVAIILLGLGALTLIA